MLNGSRKANKVFTAGLQVPLKNIWRDFETSIVHQILLIRWNKTAVFSFSHLLSLRV